MKIFSAFFSFSSLFPVDEDIKNSEVTNDPCYSNYESDDESDYGSSNSEIDIYDFANKNSIVLHLSFSYK